MRCADPSDVSLVSLVTQICSFLFLQKEQHRGRERERGNESTFRGSGAVTNTEAQEVNIWVLHWDLLATVVHVISGENGVSDLHYAASYLHANSSQHNVGRISTSVWLELVLLFGLWVERMLFFVISGVCKGWG